MNTTPHRKALPVEELKGRLHEIYYLVGKYPLHKLIPSGAYGSPGFTTQGTFARDDEDKYMSITLGIGYDWPSKEWTCRITITDGDDMIYCYWRPFTLEEWGKTLKIYNDLSMFAPALVKGFH